MSNTLSTLRAELASVLGDAGLTAVSYLPERPNPPIAVISPAQPYLEPGDTFGSFTFKLTALLLTRTATSETATGELDELIAKTVIAVAGSRFRMVSVDQPAAFQVNNANYLGATIDVAYTGYVEVS